MSHLESPAHKERPAPGPVRIGRQQYVRAPRPLHFPSEERPEEAVSETKRHLEARTTLYLLLKETFAGQAIGSDQFLYYDAADPQRCLSPDVFVKRGSNVSDFDVWKVWEGGTPELAVEIISASDRRDADWGEKMARYRASGVAEVVRFDPLDREAQVRVWDRVADDLVERAPGSPHQRECAALGLWWVVVPSDFGPQLRLARDPEGKTLLPTPTEDRVRLVRELAEERHARSQAEHERLLAEHARNVAEAERQRETEARQREAEARQREAEARQREAEARSVAEEKLREAERERNAALAELAKLRARRNGKSTKKG